MNMQCDKHLSAHPHVTFSVDDSQSLLGRLGSLGRALSRTAPAPTLGCRTKGGRADVVGDRRGGSRRLVGADIVEVSFACRSY